jgi:nucleoside-diphosphate-sugar epimerase
MVAYMLDGTRKLISPLVDWAPPLRIRDVLLVELSYTFSIEKAQKLLEYKPLIDQSEGLLRTRSWLRKLYDEA